MSGGVESIGLVERSRESFGPRLATDRLATGFRIGRVRICHVMAAFWREAQST